MCCGRCAGEVCGGASAHCRPMIEAGVALATSRVMGLLSALACARPAALRSGAVGGYWAGGWAPGWGGQEAVTWTVGWGEAGRDGLGWVGVAWRGV